MEVDCCCDSIRRRTAVVIATLTIIAITVSVALAIRFVIVADSQRIRGTTTAIFYVTSITRCRIEKRPKFILIKAPLEAVIPFFKVG